MPFFPSLDADAGPGDVFTACPDIHAYWSPMCFMSRLVQGHGFVPMSPDKARERAEQRLRPGYVGLYPGLTGGDA